MNDGNVVKKFKKVLSIEGLPFKEIQFYTFPHKLNILYMCK